ncbi:MAG: hypothetical protein IPG50_36050 [Myxococcales bacterium]|nr:hypothetical protein [Myxococcales bacterium]
MTADGSGLFKLSFVRSSASWPALAAEATFLTAFLFAVVVFVATFGAFFVLFFESSFAGALALGGAAFAFALAGGALRTVFEGCFAFVVFFFDATRHLTTAWAEWRAVPGDRGDGR